MHYIRTFILVLLTVLLPVRGALAAAMMCPGHVAAMSADEAAAVGHGGHDMQDMHDMHADPASGAHHAALQDPSQADAPSDASSAGHAKACPFCAGGCCVTPLAFAPPSVQNPHLRDSAVFPALTARVTAHYPDGQDRPPRTR